MMPVPGAFELPLAAMALAKTRRYACVVALGCVIRGETPHFDYVASEAASGLQLAALETGVPVSFGVLTVDTPRAGRGADRPGRGRRSDGARDGRRVLRSSERRPLAACTRSLHSSVRWQRSAQSVERSRPSVSSRSHSMVATKRRFDPNLQRVRVLLDGTADRARTSAPAASKRARSKKLFSAPVALRSSVGQLETARRLARHVVEVRRLTADHAAERDSTQA